MSVTYVTAGDLAAIMQDEPQSDAAAWQHHLDSLADTLGRLRRRHEPGTYDRHLLDRLAAALESLDALLAPCAAQLVAEGWQTDDALAEIDRHVDALCARMRVKR